MKLNFGNLLLNVLVLIYSLIKNGLPSKAPEIHYSGMDGAMRYLSEFGFLDTRVHPGQPQMSQADLKDSLMDFQEMCSLRQTGVLDTPTMRMMNTPRCANRDVVIHPHHHHDPTVRTGRGHYHGHPHHSLHTRHSHPHGILPASWDHGHERRVKRFVLHGTKWEQSELTYRVTKYSRQAIRPDQIDSVIDTAIRIWERQIPLRFRRSSAKEVDIEIRFAEGAHGDGNDFTGDRIWTLAHAFYPGSGLGGDVHMNDAYNWTHGNNLLYTAVHELGHSLGLRHSSIRESVMFSHFVSESPEVTLHSDDIAGIQEIYGRSRVFQAQPPPQPRPSFHPSSNPTWSPRILPSGPFVTTTTTTTTTPRPPTTTPIPTRATTTAMVNFRGDRPWSPSVPEVHDPRPQPQNPFPNHIPGLCIDGRIDAITALNSTDIIIFRDEYVASLKILNREVKLGSYMTIRDAFKNKLSSNLDAAFSLDNKVYYFKGDSVWISSRGGFEIDFGYPRRISQVFPGIPKDLDAAFAWANRQIYFFKGDEFWKFDPTQPQTPPSPTYPLKINERNWAGAPMFVEAVFRLEPQGPSYFFRSGRYWKFEDRIGSVPDVDPPYPRDARIWWFSCTDIRPRLETI